MKYIEDMNRFELMTEVERLRRAEHTVAFDKATAAHLEAENARLHRKVARLEKMLKEATSRSTVSRRATPERRVTSQERRKAPRRSP